MIVTTTPNVEGKQIVEYKQVVFGEVIAGANFMRDFFAGITDVIGGRSSVYERRISRARQDALKELEEKAYALGANAIVGVEVNYTTVGTKSMFMVIASGAIRSFFYLLKCNFCDQDRKSAVNFLRVFGVS